MEVSSPPTIRSLVCVPHRPGRGRSDSLNPCRCAVDEGLEEEEELSDEQQT